MCQSPSTSERTGSRTQSARLVGFWKSLFGKKLRRPTPLASRRPLGVELLEGRDVPAGYWWVPGPGSDLLSTTAGNWMMGPGAPWAAHTTAPDGDDHLYYVGGVASARGASSTDCVIPASGGGGSGNKFAGMHLLYGTAGLVVTTQGATAVVVGDEGGPGGPPPSPPPPPPSGSQPYPGTVYTGGSFGVGDLEQDCGTISQGGWRAPTGDGSTLTVNDLLDWTGGTFNSNSVAGTLVLDSATGLAAPAGTAPTPWAVAMGSTVDLKNGSSLDVLSGTYAVTNGDGFVVRNQCNLRLLPDPQDAPRPGGGNGGANPQQYTADVRLSPADSTKDKLGSITVEQGGTATFVPNQRPADSTAFAVYDAPKGTLENKGGTVTISDRVQAKFGGKVTSGFHDGGDPTLPAYLASVSQTAGALSVQAGSQLITNRGVAVTSGVVVFPPLNPDGTSTQIQPEAAIIATDTAAGVWALQLGTQATLTISDNPYRTVKIDGNFSWLGTVDLGISALVKERKDQIAVDGRVQIDGTAPKLRVTWAEEYHAHMASRDKDDTWTVVTSTKDVNGILGDAKVNPPELPAGATVTMETQANTAKTELKVRKTSDKVPL